MSYIVFARKYRPQSFDDVIGQSHITATLKNAIAQSRVAHAYLFAGPRGVGKTTTARIFAKSLNCEEGSKGAPCNKCAVCKEITSGSSMDILEIDGASNRGIEEIRSLRENVKFTPSKCRFKIYIIDEVHMLTPEAFNALLKTLEEPPAHVKFIFATTSPHKVPPTILSRCQRFDFRRISTGEIYDSLRKIVNDEKIKIDDGALGLIAKYGDGSMRDAQVVLDQISSSSQGKIGIEDVTKILGIVDDDILFGLSGAINDKDAVAALGIIGRVINDGKDALQIVLGLIEHFRNIAVAKISADSDALIDAGPDKIKRYRAEAEKFSIEQILYVVYTLSNTIDFMRKSNIARAPFEAAMIKLTRLSTVIQLSEIMSRIDSLQKDLSPARPAQDPDKGHVKMPLPRGPDLPADSPETPDAALKKSAEMNGNISTRKVLRIGNDMSAQPAGAASSLPSIDPEEVSGYWIKAVNCIKPRKISIASYMQEGSPAGIESGVLTVGFPKECQFHKEMLESAENKRLIEEAILAVTGLELKVAFTISDLSGAGGRARATGNIVSENDAFSTDTADTAEPDPIVKAALNIFSGKITGDDKSKGSAR